MRLTWAWMALALTGCVASEDTGAVAARMEHQDDAACTANRDYRQCRQNLLTYRQQAVAERQQNSMRLENGLNGAARALQSIDNPTVNVNMNCSGCR